MIEFRAITDENFSDCTKLSPGEGNHKFVATNTISLAQAYVAITNDTCTPMPFALYKDAKMVGFIQLAYLRADQDDAIDQPIYEVWRFMIDEHDQGKGYGKVALLKAIDYIRTFPYGQANKLYLSYVPGNDAASGLYKSIGFEATGEMDGEEIVMALKL